MEKRKSIRTRLVQTFVVVSAFVFLVNACIFYNQNKIVREVDSVYSNNIQLNDISGTLEKLQQSLYQYLKTKSSDNLEAYYIYEQDYRQKIEVLNTQISSSPIKLMEKNIHNMSESYLEKADETVKAKRGRNIARYNEGYGDAEQIYEYLQTSINSINNKVFLENSENYAVLRSSLNFMVAFGIILLAAVMLAAVVWIVMMTRNITRPLIELANAANEIAKGNIEVDFPIVDTNDEVSTVAKACNKMIGSIREYIQKTKENYKRENELMENELIMKNDLKEAQLKYLQAQINPHFLFNSLNAGAQLAMMEGAEKACMFIENMADFFRYNVRKINNDTTLGEELDLVDNYIYILNVRFSGDIHYFKQIDERLLSTLMPGMILQPIIENAVNHGIREMEGRGEIRVAVYSEDTNICIRVTDNGIGIAQDTAGKIMRGESAHSENQRDSAGIGMDNVINRLRTFYNIHHVLDIGRGKESGTEVVIYIPREKEGESYDENINL